MMRFDDDCIHDFVDDVCVHCGEIKGCDECVADEYDVVVEVIGGDRLVEIRRLCGECAGRLLDQE